MTRRASIGFLFCSLSLLSAHAQWTREDSIRLQRMLDSKEEIKINREAVNAIQWDVPQKKNPLGKPLMKEDKPWMEFRTDMPSDYTEKSTDKTTLKTVPYIRMLPYTIYTRWNENPVDDVLSKTQKDSLKRWTIRMKLFHIKPDPSRMNGHVVVPEGMDPTVSPSAYPLLSGLDIDKLIFENLTKKGRMLKHNRKHAQAWKHYQNYIPVRSDSLQKNILPGDTIPQDTVPRNKIAQDTVPQRAVLQDTVPPKDIPQESSVPKRQGIAPTRNPNKEKR